MNPGRIVPAEERFWEHVDRTADCWIWTGATNNRYGRLSEGPRGARRDIYAHRLSWSIHFGAVPDGMSVLHRCDNPPCVRPSHLFLGTQTDNMRDMSAKGRNGLAVNPSRAARGEAVGGHKVTEQNVREIRQLAAIGWKTTRIAEIYGLTAVNVRYIIRRLTWRHVA